MTWSRVASLEDLWSGEARRAGAEGTGVLLVRTGDDVVAYVDACPHQGVPLSEGSFDGETLVCRAHRWEFDARSGEGRNPRGACLRRLPVRLEDGAIFVDTSPAPRPRTRRPSVGPVLRAGRTAQAVIAAIRETNPGVSVIDRGSYLRVSVPGRCRLERDAVERHLARPFELPGDLEVVMPSFEGRLTLDEDSAMWTEGR